MAFSDFFFGWGRTSGDAELPEIFPIGIAQPLFIEIDVINIFSKILVDCLERTNGLSEELLPLMWDNCVMSNTYHGLITLLAHAMAYRKELFIVYEPAIKVIRQATGAEQVTIRADYIAQGESSVGTFLSFKHFIRADMIRVYSALQYCTVSSLHKSMNLSKAIQMKMNDLRAGVSLTDSADVKAQAQLMAKALASGKDILCDAKDIIETSKPDLTATQASVEFLNQKMAFYLGLPACYITGEQTGGLSTTGEGDQKAIERGLKSYYFSILKPTLETLFDIKTTYKSQDFRQISSSMDVLKTFSMTDDTIVSLDNKTKIMNAMLELPEDAEGDPAPPPPVIQVNSPPVPGQPPVKGAQPPAKVNA